MPALKSICLFCGSSNDVEQRFLDLATALGSRLAERGYRLVYGGGGVGLMGAAASAAHEAGGDVLGIMPRFVERTHLRLGRAPHRGNHARRKQMCSKRAMPSSFCLAALALEEAVEILSWARLNLHAKPMAFLDEGDFWKPFFELMDHIVKGKFTPEEFLEQFAHTTTPDAAIDALEDRCVQLQ